MENNDIVFGFFQEIDICGFPRVINLAIFDYTKTVRRVCTNRLIGNARSTKPCDDMNLMASTHKISDHQACRNCNSVNLGMESERYDDDFHG